ncbi:hypothetical protein ACO0OE_001927 [Hanseniaspora uvarum]
MANSSTYEYDENSETFPFFILTALLSVTVPWTIKLVYQLLSNNNFKSIKSIRLKLANIDESGKDEETAEKQKKTIESLYELQDSLKKDTFKKLEYEYLKTTNSKSYTKEIIIVTVLWALTAYVYQLINNNTKIFESIASQFDPYELLGVTLSSTEKDIKSAYRKLSLKFHPDKLPSGLTDIEKLKYEESFILINKAYQVLTDEAVKENYMKYGHPDGPQQVSQGIALPKFIIDNGFYSIVMILAYCVVFMGIIPYFVSKWWNNSSQVNKQGINIETSSYIIERVFNLKKGSVVDHNLILEWLSNAYEYKVQFPDLDSDDIYNIFIDHINRETKLTEENTKITDEIKFKVISKTHSLIKFILTVASCFNNLTLSIACIDCMKSITQAINPDKDEPRYELLQLPGVDKLPELTADFKYRGIKNIEQIFMLGNEEKCQVLGIENKKEFSEQIDKYNHSVPKLQVLSSKVVVQGQDYVSPGAVVHIQLKVVMTGVNFVSSLKPALNLLFSAKDKIEKNEDKYQSIEHLLDPHKKMHEQETLPPVFAPRFPVTKDTEYIILMVGNGKVLQTPIFFNKANWSDNLNSKSYDRLDKKEFSKEVIKSQQEKKQLQLKPDLIEDMKYSFVTIPCPAPAAEQPGEYSFKIYLDHFGMFGYDQYITVPYKVLSEEEINAYEEKTKQEKIAAGEYNEEDEEDEYGLSDEDDEEDEEDAEEEVSEDDDDYSDINTDTDEE